MISIFIRRFTSLVYDGTIETLLVRFVIQNQVPIHQKYRDMLVFIGELAKLEKLFRVSFTVQRQAEWRALELYFRGVTSPMTPIVATIRTLCDIRLEFKIDFFPEQLSTVPHYMFLSHLKSQSLTHGAPSIELVKRLSREYAHDGGNNLLGPSGYALPPYLFTITQTPPTIPNLLFA